LPTTSEEVVRLEGVSKRYRRRESETLKEFLAAVARRKAAEPPFYALRDVSFSVRRGETVGIIGRNGSGKTTVLKLIAGVTVPTAGKVTVGGRVSALIELGAGFHPDLTGRENVYLKASILGMSRRRTRESYDAIVEFAELRAFMDTPVKRYSSGMFTRLAFAVAVHSQPEVFLIDESLSVGDAAFREKCYAKVRDFQAGGGTIVLVSHDLQTVASYCDRVLHLEDGRLLFDGDAEEGIARYAASREPAAAV